MSLAHTSWIWNTEQTTLETQAESDMSGYGN